MPHPILNHSAALTSLCITNSTILPLPFCPLNRLARKPLNLPKSTGLSGEQKIGLTALQFGLFFLAHA